MFVYPYKNGSRSVKALKEALGLKIIKREGSKFKGSPHKTVINWGASALPDSVVACRVLNCHLPVRTASCKLAAFQIMEGEVSIPPFTIDQAEAAGWIQEGHTVVCRKTTRGSGGEGIVVAEEEGTLINAPLYTQYVKKESEWRVHIFCGEVIDVQRKVRNNDIPDDMIDWKIRNHDRGFIFQRNNINPPVSVIEQASAAIGALSLDFGAVDVIYNKHRDTSYVLEVNCAPGLEGTTIESYTNAIKEIV